MYNVRHFRIYHTVLLALLVVSAVFSGKVSAQVSITWQLYSVDNHYDYHHNRPASPSHLQKVDNISLVGGHYLYSADMRVSEDGLYVVDFKNTSTIDRFSFYIYDQQNNLIDKASGGIGSTEPNPFFSGMDDCLNWPRVNIDWSQKCPRHITSRNQNPTSIR